MPLPTSYRSRPLTFLVLLLSILSITIQQLAKPPHPSALKPKIFVLGLSKTGTTSIGDALERLGYRRLGWRDVRSRHTIHSWAHGNMDPLKKLTNYYDAFEDLPWSHVFRDMADKWPDAKFVLSLRSDEQKWLKSMRVHVGRGAWEPYKFFYGVDRIEGKEDEAIVLAKYRNHTRDVRAFFEDKKDRYVEMRIDDDGAVNWKALCQVAECPGGRSPTVEFPRSNTAATWNTGPISRNVSWCRGWIITRVEEWATWYYYYSGETLLKPVLRACWSMIDLLERAFSVCEFTIVRPWVLLPEVAQLPGNT